MKLILATISALVVTSTMAMACPWANGRYTGEVGDVDVQLVINSNCTQVSMIETEGNTKQSVAMNKVKKGWNADFADQTSIAFDANGKRARGKRGGLSRSIRLKRTN